jgi:D-alanine-D-alanine ligase
MTPTSLVPEMAAHAGIPFPDLVAWMVEDASLER